MKKWSLCLICSFLFVTINSKAQIFTDKVHHEVNLEFLKHNQQEFNLQLNQLELWEHTQELPFNSETNHLSKSACEENISQIDHLLETYFYAIHLQKLAIDCHNLLADTEHASIHEAHLLNLAQLVTESGDGTSFDSAFWITDMDSAYEFLRIAGFEIIDGEIRLNENEAYLAAYVKDDAVFGEYRYFKLNHFFNAINDTINKELTDDDKKYNSILNLVLKTELDNNIGLITLAYAGITEAQILLGKLMLSKANSYPTLYSESYELFRLAAESGSAIGQYNFAYRIFIDNHEGDYSIGHQYITSSIEQRYLPAFTLAVIVREKKLGIKKESETIENLIQLINSETSEPGIFEYTIGLQFLHDQYWNDTKLAQKYFEISAEKGHPEGIIEFADGLNYGRVGFEKNKKAMKWYEKATTTDQSGIAYLRLGQLKGNGDGMRTDIDESISLFNKAGESGVSDGHAYAGHLNYYNRYKNINFNDAYAFYEKASKDKNAKGLFHLGLMHYLGQSTAIDYSKAFDYFSQADDLDFNDAKLYLAAMYELGQGVKQDHRKAQKLYRQILGDYDLTFTNEWKTKILARLNNLLLTSNYRQPVLPIDNHIKILEEKSKTDHIALFQLGFLGFSEYSDDVSYSKGKRMIKKAAKNGVKEAAYLYSNQFGEGGIKNKHEAFFEMALKLNDANAIYLKAKRIEKSNPSKAIELLKLNHNRNHLPSSLMLARIYEEGEYVTKDLKKAIEYYSQVVELGGGVVVFDLIEIYLDQDSEFGNIELALSELKLLAESKDNSRAMRNLGEIYSNDNFKYKDIDEAVNWFIKAYENGSTESSTVLGKMNLYGIDLPQNFELANFFFTNAIANNSNELSLLFNEPSEFWLALMLQNGYGVDQDTETAKLLYRALTVSKRKKEAQNNFAVLTCKDHNSGDKEKEIAFNLIKINSSSSRTAQFNLGWMYEHGICTKKNRDAALEAYQNSADKKSPHALFRLSQLYSNGELYEKNETIANEFYQSSIEASKKIKYHNMMNTFLDLPYIKDLKMVDYKNSQPSK